MKIDAYRIGDAANNRDTQLILSIFSERFPKLLRFRDYSWRVILATWESPGLVRMRTPIGSFGWYHDEYYEDGGIFSYDNLCVMIFNPDFFSHDT